MKQIIALYDFFESVTEAMLPCANAMMATVEQIEGSLMMRIQIGCKEPPASQTAWSLPEGNVLCETQDDDLIITASLHLGGETA